MTTDNSRADALTETKLPDGSGFAVASLPLPHDHWLYEGRSAEWDSERDTSADTPHPILTHAHRDAVVAAVRYAVRGATMCGKEADFDPDALVLNAVYALCGPHGRIIEEVPTWKRDIQKVIDSLDPEDWCGDESMISVLERALAASPIEQPAAAPIDDREPPAVSDLPRFPTVLRKMWSGTEVQQWIDDNIKPLVQERRHDSHCGSNAAPQPVSIPAGWKAMPPSATTAMRMAMAKAAADYMQRTGGNSPDAIYEAGFAAAPQPAPAAIPAGYALVPIEPTDAMIESGAAAGVPDGEGLYYPFSADEIGIAYCAMIAARPRAPQPAQADARQIADMIDHLNLLCDELGQYDKVPDEAYGDPYAMSVTFMQLRNAVQRMKASAQADARVGLTDEQRETILDVIKISTDRRAVLALRALLESHTK